jgi:serine/threonine protein phosphatase PrpC
MMHFTSATASVLGNTHYKLYYNNQDAYQYYQDNTCVIGVVADGCGSGSNSEVGSRLAVDFVVNFCRKHFGNQPFDADFLQNSLLEFLRQVVKNQLVSDESEFIENYLYFTLFGFVVQPEQTCIFHSGDGLYLLNDKQVIIEQNNRPNYLAKNLLGGQSSLETEFIETSKLNRLLVATDGLLHLNEKFSQDETVEGMKSITDLFDQDVYFENQVALPRLLTDLSLNKQILKDDTTAILIKRSGITF